MLDGLNDKQREAVINTEGACLVLAGAGSGKTKVLTTRIAYLIKEFGQVISVDYNNKKAVVEAYSYNGYKSSVIADIIVVKENMVEDRCYIPEGNGKHHTTWPITILFILLFLSLISVITFLAVLKAFLSFGSFK